VPGSNSNPRTQERTVSTVNEIVSQKGHSIFTIGSAASALDATREMNRRQIGALVVTDAGKVVGIVTERDILRHVVAEERAPADVRVGEIMTEEVICVTPDTDFLQASEIMREKRVRHLPVCDGNGHLLGMVSIGDLNARHSSHQAQTIHYLNDYIYGRV
jgi:CBS domain-containing protein